MGLELEYINGQTPLDEEEKTGLLISTIANRSELDEFEQQNIEEAIQWVLTRSLKADQILTEKFVRNLHKRMYGNVWSWAGDFRKTDKIISSPMAVSRATRSASGASLQATASEEKMKQRKVRYK